MKFSLRKELPQLLLIAGMFALAAICWSQAPEKMPIHWNFRGVADGYGGKFAGLLLLPLIAAATYLLTLLVPLVDPGRLNYRNFAKVYNTFRLVLMLFLGVIYVVTLLAAFGHHVNMTMIVMLATAVLFLVIGNFMSKIRPNWFFGVRTPWTLSSKLSWDKTHRLAGWLFALMGVLLAIAAFVNTGWMFIATFTVVGVCMVWMIVYSYLVYRHDPERTSPAGVSPSTEEPN
jgi:uncharacterized membrane protein